jgi:hypothetical protein
MLLVSMLMCHVVSVGVVTNPLHYWCCCFLALLVLLVICCVVGASVGSSHS